MTSQVLRLSRRLALCLIGLAVLQGLVLVLGFIGVPADKEWSLLALLAIVWVLWLLSFATNYALVSHGTVATRYELTGHFINRPGLFMRVVSHVMVNWSAIAATLLLAALALEPQTKSILAILVIAAVPLVWIGFNIRHRRMNHLRNLTISTAFAVALGLGGIVLLVTIL